MYRQLPNALTLLRLVLAAVFFVVLNQYRYDAGGPDGWLIAAIVLFILAALTDALDGHLARKWKVESQFGRIMDPFCDKILVIGAFIYLAGPRFVIPEVVSQYSLFNMVSGVYPWMVLIILAREMIVTAIRGEMEGKGTKFGANWFGKAKMILQSVSIPIVLLIVFLDPRAEGNHWMSWLRDTLVYATVIVTFFSGVPYVTSAAALIKKREGGD